jgi:hypothetical protein
LGNLEAIAAPRDGPEYLSVVVAEDAPDLMDALDQAVVRDSGVGPDGLRQFASPDHSPGIEGKISEHREGLRPQREVHAGPVSNSFACEIDPQLTDRKPMIGAFAHTALLSDARRSIHLYIGTGTITMPGRSRSFSI